MVIITNEEQLEQVDWNEKTVPLGVSTNPSHSIKLDREELRILRLLLERPLGGETPCSSGGLLVLHRFIRSMEEFMERKIQ